MSSDRPIRLGLNTRIAIGSKSRPTKDSVPTSVDPLPAPVPRPDWPAHIAAIAALAIAGDAGVGDTIKRTVDVFPDLVVDAGKRFKAWWTGEKTCNCERDRVKLNAMYPYR